jgi:hypothetical protein
VVELPEAYKPILPFRSVDPALHTSRLDAAMNHGVVSPQYQIAREKLILALSGDGLV